MTPGKAIAPLLLVGLLQSASLLNPFALDSPSEMDRYRTMPIRFGGVIGCKHLASVLVFLLTTLPLLLACVWCMPWPSGLHTCIETGLVVSGSLLSAMLLMRAPSARMIRMGFWKLSGEGMSLGLFISASMLTAMPLLVCWLIQSRSQSPFFGAGISMGSISVLMFVYADWLDRLDWA